MKKFTIALGSHENIDLKENISNHDHPHVDYIDLLNDIDGELYSFTNLETSQSPVIRIFSRICGLYWALALFTLCKSKSISSLLATGEDIGFPIALIYGLFRPKKNIFIIIHGSYLRSSKVRIIFYLLKGMANIHFLCISETLTRHLIECHKLPEHRVVNAGYGIDTAFFNPISVHDRDQILIASAGMANRDYKTLLAAVVDLDIELKIAADSAWYQSALDISNQDLPSNVDVRSYKNYIGLRELYASSSFVVVPLYPALHACGYAVIAEAMAMGKPVIATKTQSYSDYIIEGVTGFYVPAGDVNALKERIQYLIDNPDLRKWMGEQARQHMVNHYSLKAYNQRIAQSMGLSLQDKI